ncbi:MAG: Hsp20/alpha crystallin family protein [Bdellovibrionales bacterium]|nr:Hsp20/alpha crystallin family protein [Bdellovibrionales bacterium]
MLNYYFWNLPEARSWEMEESEDHYLLDLEIPGVPSDKIALEAAENRITVSGEHRKGKFHRTFSLPMDVDASKIEANHQDGVLRILLPKVEAAKPRQIKISSGSGHGLFSKLIGQSASNPSKDKVAS